MNTHRHAQMESLLRRHDQARSALEAQRGRHAAAQERLDALHKECERRGVHPDALDSSIQRAEVKLDKLMEQYEQNIELVENQLRKIQGK